jgi:hypothetical protein
VPTMAGIHAAGDFEPLPTTRAELIEHWRAKLGDSGMRDVFDVIVKADDDGNTDLHDDDIAQAVGVRAKGSTIRQYIGRLARLGVIRKTGTVVTLSEQFGR